LEQIATLIRKRGLIVMVSDFLASPETLQTNLAYLRSRGHEVLLIRTLDPAEIDFQLPKAGMVVDMESGKEIFVDPETARAEYETRFREHEEQIRSICDSLGVDFYRVRTDESLDGVLFDIVSSQQRRARSVARRGALAAASRGGAA
jgi:uncharacterized protein (DUF58 family)